MYLVVYNAGMTIASVLCTASVVFTLLNRGLSKVWVGAGQMFVVTQWLALLETVHAAAGVSKSSAGTAFAQWFGKSNVLLAILCFVPELQNSWATAMLMFVWSSSEVVRYYYYLLTIVMGTTIPERLTWLRYTIFIPMYPIGMLCELLIMVLARPHIKGLHRVSLPNALNFGFDYQAFISALVWVYPLVWLPMYLHMFKLRAKKLGDGSRNKLKKSQ